VDAAAGTVTVSLTGAATGRVVSTPPGIDCPGTCSASFAGGTQLTLAPSQDATTWFARWSGACGGQGTCALTVNGDAAVVATFEPLPNRVFVTKNAVPGNFGGLAAADTLCTPTAPNAGMTGTFRAWLSTSTVDAIDRVTGSRGWIRTDGAPVADTIADMVGGRMLHPLDVDEAGMTIGVNTSAWTGSDESGRAGSIGHCTDWTATMGFGQEHITAYAFLPSLGGVGSGCNSSNPIMCFEVGRNVTTVAPSPETGRHAFVTRGRLAGSSGVAAFDNLCASEATTASLSGTFRAAVATTTSSIASRFALDARPWVRMDGTRLSETPAGLFDTIPLRSFVNQYADGVYGSNGVWLGAASPNAPGTPETTCNDWSSSTLTLIPIGYPFVVHAQFWGGSVFANVCSDPWALLCLEE
jgi:hypothetical protein